jgi:CHAT domain-containing protein
VAILILVACSRESEEKRARQRAPGDDSSQRLTFGPEQGRLVGVEWVDASSPGSLRARAPGLRHNAIQALKGDESGSAIGALRADAVIALLSGESDQAIARLSRAAALAPGNAILASDLAAARLQRGSAFSDGEDFFLALAAANIAVHLAPALPEARFNRALALQRLSLYERASGEWQLFQSLERDLRWLQVARGHIEVMTRITRRPTREARLETVQQAVERGDPRRVREVVSAAPQLFREYAEGDLLVAWAEAEAQRNEAEARRLLTLARTIGNALVAINGERMTANTVAHIEDLRRNEPTGLFRLVQAFQEYGRGISLTQHADFVTALPHFERSRQGLAAQRSPFSDWATVGIALCHFQIPEYAEALSLLRPLTQDQYRARYPALHGRSLWLTGLIAIAQGDPTVSVTAYKLALADYRQLGETANAARMASQVAIGLDYLGRRKEAWRQLYPSLIEPETLDQPASRMAICEIASWLAKAGGQNEIALWFQDEVVRIAYSMGEAYRVVVALRGRGEILTAIGDRDAAMKDLEQARGTVKSVPDPDTRRNLEGGLKLAAAGLAGSPGESIELLDDVINYFRSSEYHYRLAQAYYARAQAWEVFGRSDEEERDLAAAIVEFEQQRKKITALEERISFFDRTREILDAMVRFQLERRHRPEAAFRYSEQAKARTLLDWLLTHPVSELAPESSNGDGPATADPRSLRQFLPPATTVVEYSVLPQSLVIWILRQDGFRIETITIERRTLENLIHRLTRDLDQGRRADFLKTSSQLYDLLIRPIMPHLPAGDRIVAVPDRALHGLPFALLRNGQTGRYLMEDHICSVAPSVRVLIASLRRDRELVRPQTPRVLMIADPDFDHELFPNLSRLQASETEAAVARLFPGSRILSDQGATLRAFLDEAKGFEIVYFGGHSLVNLEHPLFSQMLFARDRDDPSRGILYSGNILHQRFERTRLAVLASCSTAAGRISYTEGVESLARPFLAAGVPAVVASLWNVNDKVTAEFFSRFYGHLRQDFNPAAALQRSQIESLRSGAAEVAEPRAWGAFEVIGGSASRD